jgi:uncharacterized membrane protein
MLNIPRPSPQTQRHWLRYLMVLLIGMGLWFRTANLDRKVFWDDEALSALRISGYTSVEATRELYTTQDLSFADLQPYLSPDNDKSLGQMVQGIATEDPHLPLSYFLLARFWMQVWGNSVVVLRSLSVLFSLLCLPAMFWLCWELFRSHQAAWMGTVLMAVSPFHVLYSQEGRYYSLWVFIMLLSNIAFLKSLRQSTVRHWTGYGVLVALGIYSHLFQTLTIVGHGIYTLILERFRLGKRLLPYLIATTIGSLAFFPWLINLLLRKETAQEMMISALNQRYSLISLLAMGVGNISRLFFDVGIGSHDSWQAIVPAVPIIVAVTALITYAFWFLWRHADRRISGFIFTFTFTPSVFYLASDLCFGGRLSGLPRYAIALFLGIQLAVTYLFTHQVKRRWTMIIALVLSGCLFSCALSLPAIVWWHKGPQNTRYIPLVVALLNQSPSPYIITDQGFARIPALAHQLKPTARFQLVPIARAPRIPAQPDIFVFRPSRVLVQKLTQMHQTLLPLPTTGGALYRLEANSVQNMGR